MKFKNIVNAKIIKKKVKEVVRDALVEDIEALVVDVEVETVSEVEETLLKPNARKLLMLVKEKVKDKMAVMEALDVTEEEIAEEREMAVRGQMVVLKKSKRMKKVKKETEDNAEVMEEGESVKMVQMMLTREVRIDLNVVNVVII